MKHLTKRLLCLLLAALLTLALAGCGENPTPSTEAPQTQTQAPETKSQSPETKEARPDEQGNSSDATKEAVPQDTRTRTGDETQDPAYAASRDVRPGEDASLATRTRETERTDLGEGGKTILFDVTFRDGAEAHYRIFTDAENVGDALTQVELIEGELAGYGLYVKTVCGETLDWDADQMYWAFYENGEYAATGVDTTPVADGACYAFVATKG